MNGAPHWAALVPYAAIAVALVLRWRSISRPRPLRAVALIVPPLVVAAVVGLLLWELPHARWQGPVFASGLVLGAAAGWQRSRLMHLARDPASGRVMVRNSPLAFLLVLAVLAARRLFLWELGVDPAAGAGQGLAGLLAIHGSLGFVLGLIVASRLELWRRARMLDPV